MAAFFSGTDTSTLQKEGNDTNCFVSLIVNTEGTYCAAITRKVTLKREITVVDKGSSYEFFGEGTHALSTGMECTKEVNSEEIQYFMLDVERHEVHNPMAFLDERFEEIQAKKEASKKVILVQEDNEIKNNSDFLPWYHKMKNANIEEPYLFDGDTMKEMTCAGYDWTPDKKLIHQMVCKMITGSLILNTEKFDLKQWITRHMNNAYEKIFADKTQFTEWLEFIVPFFVFHFYDENTPMDIEDDDYFILVAQSMAEELEPYDNDNYPYIKQYINELNNVNI